MTNMWQHILIMDVSESPVKSGSGSQSVNEPRYIKKGRISPFPHLALPLLVPSKELSNLIQEAGVLLPATQAEGGLCRAACRCHGCISSCLCLMWRSCVSLK